MSAPEVEPSNLVEIHAERVGNVAAADIPFHTPAASGSGAYENAFDLERFRKAMEIRTTRLSNWRTEFDLVGVDASIANALRRTLMAEVPTIAIERVYVSDNTSIIQDEVLAHRLGLVPLAVDPESMDTKLPEDGPDDLNTLAFELSVACERNPSAKKDEKNPEKKYINANVYSSHLKWTPQGDQEQRFAEIPPKPVFDDILLAKLRPGQKLEMVLHCQKGIGKDHAKFSPVSTATYRLLPHIQILSPIPPEHIQKFLKCFPTGVIGVRSNKKTGKEEAYVQDARKDTVSREVLRHSEFDGKVKLGRIRDHFLFDVESTGAIPPEKLLPSAVRVLVSKIRMVRSSLDSLERAHGLEPGR